jgi:hypothetical protein
MTDVMDRSGTAASDGGMGIIGMGDDVVRKPADAATRIGWEAHQTGAL